MIRHRFVIFSELKHILVVRSTGLASVVQWSRTLPDCQGSWGSNPVKIVFCLSLLPFRMEKRVCLAEPCIVNAKSKDREKRFIECNSPGCSKSFHAHCIGHAKMPDKDLNNFFFVCSKCKAFLEYSADIARASLLSELETKLNVFQISILEKVEDRLRAECTNLSRETKSVIDSFTSHINEKINEVKLQTSEANEFTLSIIRDKEKDIDFLKTDVINQVESLTNELNVLRTHCDQMQKQYSSLDSKRRKKSFIIRNFPEEACNVKGKVVSTCEGALDSITECLNIDKNLIHIKGISRIGKRKEDGKPRLIAVKATENTVSQFLKNSRRLKQCDAPLNRVFLQEDLPFQVTKKLSEMRQRAYQFRTENPGKEAYVKGKRLYINGVVVDEVVQNF